MRQGNIIIRRETPVDYAAVEHLTREAFWNVYRPGCLEHYMVHVLLQDQDFVPVSIDSGPNRDPTDNPHNANRTLSQNDKFSDHGLRCMA